MKVHLTLITVAILALLSLANVRGAEVPSGFVAESVVQGIDAATALAIAQDGRVFFAEQTGAVRVWTGERLLPEPALNLADRLDTYWERGLLGITLHPDFPRTPQVFVVYVAREPFTHHVVSRFTVAGDRIDPECEMILLEGDDQSKLGGFKPSGHQGGPVRIGPDGRLYVGLGEQTAGKPAQALDSLLGKILRIEVDGSIPDDNPFVAQASGKYRAIWALGMRNPFGLAFEPDTGRLWETDVGQTSFEEVNIIVKGGNYGWPEAEGRSADTAFINPVHAYPPAIGRSIVGGTFYPVAASAPARQFPEKWRGRFFFADWANHWIKALDPKHPDDVATFARNLNGPVALDPAPDGSLYVLNRGTIWRDPGRFVANSGSLVRIRHLGDAAPNAAGDEAPIPDALEDTGLFTAYQPLTVHSRFSFFTLNAPPWQPGLKARRWLSLPAGGKISVRDDGEWEFPAGAVVVQHFILDGGGRDRAPFETHILWFTGPRHVRAGAYRWSADGSSATLVEDAEIVPLPGQATRHWFTPGAETNLDLDRVVTGFTLPLNSRQANRDGQLERWNDAGRFAPRLTNIAALPRLAAIDDRNAPLQQRVRSYLDVNCSACHRPGGASRGEFDARIATPLAGQGLLNGKVIAGDLGIEGANVVVPGRPDLSILLQRLKRTDFYRMPPVAFSDDPSPLVPVLEEWIRSLPAVEQARR